MKRYEAVETILRSVGSDDLVLTTTGMISREAFAADDRPGTFYMIGSMGLLSSLGLGLALLKPDHRVVIVDGDGSALMSLGTLPLIAHEAPTNLTYVVLDNHAYESTGGQYCISCRADLSRIAEAAGFRDVRQTADPGELENHMRALSAVDGPVCIHVNVEMGRVDGILRVAHSPTQIRDRLQRHLLST